MRPYRTLLFVPGNRERMLEKAPSLGADAILADLEDGVPIGEKDATRELLAAWLSGILKPWSARRSRGSSCRRWEARKRSTKWRDGSTSSRTPPELPGAR